MTISHRPILRAFQAALLLMLMPGCALEKPLPANTPPPTNLIITRDTPIQSTGVKRQPPVDLAETSPLPPGPPEIYAWQRGFWLWNGSDFVWNKGKWARRPNYGAEWLSPHWDQVEGSWVFVNGCWR